MQVTAGVSKIRKSVWCDLNSIFIELSETLNNFVKIRLLLETKNVAIFIKICFHLKRGCMKMLKHAETFYADKSCYMAIVFFLPISLFPKKKFRVQFSNIICTKTRPSTPQLFIWKWITSTFSFILLEKNGNVVSPWGPLFQRGPFFLRSRIGRLDRL